jgi:hypothetical protein
MASRPEMRIITAQESSHGRRQRQQLCVDIGSYKHPYFSNSVRRQIQESGKEVFSPKLSAKILEKQYERRASLLGLHSFGDGSMDNEFGGILTSAQIRKSMMMGNDANSTSASATIGANSATNKKHMPPTIETNAMDDNNNNSKNSEDGGQGHKMPTNSKLENKDASDSEETVDWNARARTYNPIFIRQKRKVASALLEMSKNHGVRNAVVRDGGVKALGALVRMFDTAIDADCSDALCCLADAEQTRNAMFADGALKAILHLAARTTSNATKYSLALALGSLACESGYETDLIDSNSLHSLLDMQTSANTREMDKAVGRALYNFATSSTDHGRHGEIASCLLSAPVGATLLSSSFSPNSPSSNKSKQLPVLQSSASCRNMFYRSIACMARMRSLHGMLVNGGIISMLKDLMDRMLFDDTVNYQEEGMTSVEASTICIIILCLLSSTPSIRVSMVVKGSIEIVMNVANDAMSRMEAGDKDYVNNNDNVYHDSDADADIVCLAVAMLTNLSLNAQTRSHVVSAGAVPVIIDLSQGGNKGIARACASALRGLTSDNNTDNLIRIMHDGGIQAVLYLSSSTKDVVTRRNCALAIRNIFSHTETLEELLNNATLASVLSEM